MKKPRTLRDLRERVAAAKADDANAQWLPIKAGILQRGYTEDVADRGIAEAIAANSVDDHFGFVLAVNDLLTKEKPPRAKPIAVPKTKKNNEGKVPEGPGACRILRRVEIFDFSLFALICV